MHLRISDGVTDALANIGKSRLDSYLDGQRQSKMPLFELYAYSGCPQRYRR